ncbi:MAG: HAD family phosphatase [bacterium]|nr:HAD family phosphatase [bacterium]
MNKPTSPRFEAVFFDMDGLLVDTESLYLDATREVFAPFDVEVSLDWYMTEQLGKGTSTFSLLEAKGIAQDVIQETRVRRNKRYMEMLEGIEPIQGVRETLLQLHGKFALAVVTSSNREPFEIIMRNTELKHFFDFSITFDDVTSLKPDPKPYQKAVEHSGFEKENCLALEDSSKGVSAAKAAGISCYAIPDELTKGHDFSMADKVLGSIREVPALLRV